MSTPVPPSSGGRNWRTLVPGRDLDAMVAEIGRGWKRHAQPKDARGEHGGDPVLMRPGESLDNLGSFALPPLGCLHLAYFVPQWSTDLGAALRLLLELERDREQTLSTITRKSDCGVPVQWFVELRDCEAPWRIVTAHNANLPLAICNAVLALAAESAKLLEVVHV